MEKLRDSISITRPGASLRYLAHRLGSTPDYIPDALLSYPELVPRYPELANAVYCIVLYCIYDGG